MKIDQCQLLLSRTKWCLYMKKGLFSHMKVKKEHRIRAYTTTLIQNLLLNKVLQVSMMIWVGGMIHSDIYKKFQDKVMIAKKNYPRSQG